MPKVPDAIVEMSSVTTQFHLCIFAASRHHRDAEGPGNRVISTQNASFCLLVHLDNQSSISITGDYRGLLHLAAAHYDLILVLSPIDRS
jgi:hypothetical protein